MRVLIVDDEQITSFALSITLSEEGYEVATAGSGTEAIETGKAFQPDILISDWFLKDKFNGLDVAKSLLEIKPNLQVIFITGRPAEEVEDDLKDFKTFKLFTKPYDLDVVLSTLLPAKPSMQMVQ